ncbi:MAG: hypothetical protein AAF676_00230 [Pseudomonadota bacterium]
MKRPRLLVLAMLAAARVAPASAEPPAQAMVMWDGSPSLGGAWIAHPDHLGPGSPLVTLRTEDGGRTQARLVRRGGTGSGYLLAAETARALGLEPGEPALISVAWPTIDPEPSPDEDPVEAADAGALDEAADADGAPETAEAIAAEDDLREVDVPGPEQAETASREAPGAGRRDVATGGQAPAAAGPAPTDRPPAPDDVATTAAATSPRPVPRPDAPSGEARRDPAGDEDVVAPDPIAEVGPDLEPPTASDAAEPPPHAAPDLAERPRRRPVAPAASRPDDSPTPEPRPPEEGAPA